MMPREHGSWAVLLLPLVVGLAAAHGGPAAPVTLLFIAALGGFLLREPLRSLAGPAPAAGAAGWAVGYAALMLAAAAPLLVVWRLRLLVLFGAVGGAALALNVRELGARRMFSWLNEASGVLALCLGAPAAFYAARGRLEAAAWEAWALCALYFVGPLFHVKLVALQHRAAAGGAPPGALDAARRASLGYHAAALAAVLAAACAGRAPWLAALPFLAALHKAWRRGRLGPGKVDFRRLGYQEVGYACLFAGAAAAGLLSP